MLLSMEMNCSVERLASFASCRTLVTTTCQGVCVWRLLAQPKQSKWIYHPALLPPLSSTPHTCLPFLDPEYTSSSSAYSRSAAIGSRWVEEVRTWEEGEEEGRGKK